MCLSVLARSLKTSGIGRLLVTVTEAQELKACKPNGEVIQWDRLWNGNIFNVIYLQKNKYSYTDCLLT